MPNAFVYCLSSAGFDDVIRMIIIIFREKKL